MYTSKNPQKPTLLLSNRLEQVESLFTTHMKPALRRKKHLFSLMGATFLKTAGVCGTAELLGQCQWAGSRPTVTTQMHFIFQALILDEWWKFSLKFSIQQNSTTWQFKGLSCVQRVNSKASPLPIFPAISHPISRRLGCGPHTGRDFLAPVFLSSQLPTTCHWLPPKLLLLNLPRCSLTLPPLGVLFWHLLQPLHPCPDPRQPHLLGSSALVSSSSGRGPLSRGQQSTTPATSRPVGKLSQEVCVCCLGQTLHSSWALRSTRSLCKNVSLPWH